MSTYASRCIKPLGHRGRCRDRYGRTWENNHPPIMQAVPIDAIRTLVRLALDVDEMTDADYDAQTEAAAVLLPLIEGPS